MTRHHRNQSERGSTAELDPWSLEGLSDREPKPTAVMRRDDLLELVNATTPAASVSANAVPRVLLERHRVASDHSQPIHVDYDDDSGVSPLVVLAIIGILIGMFAAIVLST